MTRAGTGKTCASAFAMREENQKRVLFLVHREQIAKQAMESYERVFGNTRTFGLLSGNLKNYEDNMRRYVADPMGNIIARAEKEPELLIAQIDTDREKEVRKTLPSLENRRPDLYRIGDLRH